MTEFVKKSWKSAARHPFNLALGLMPAVGFVVIATTLVLT